jgi:RNA polymerase-binding transcription factor DksA
MIRHGKGTGMTDAPERILATSWQYCGCDQDWSAGEWEIYYGQVADEALVEYIRADAAEAEKRAAVAAERGRVLRKVAAYEVCDSTGGEHVIMRDGVYKFCQECGETLTSAKIREAVRAAAIRQGAPE